MDGDLSGRWISVWPELLLALGTSASLLSLLVFTMVHLDKTNGKQSLDHPFRRRIHDFIEGNPGVNLRGLWEGLDARRGTTHYHCAVLERGGFVKTVKINGTRRFFHKDFAGPQMDATCVLLRGRVLELASHVLHEPGATPERLRRVVPLSRRVFLIYAALLDEKHLVQKVGDHRLTRYFPTPLLEQLVPLLAPDEPEPVREPPIVMMVGGRRN